jgi:hypothetical protein
MMDEIILNDCITSVPYKYFCNDEDNRSSITIIMNMEKEYEKHFTNWENRIYDHPIVIG